MLKKLSIGGMAAFIVLIQAIPTAAAGPIQQARAALLLDGKTGQVLYQHNGFDRNYPASTTKLLTALVAAEHGKLDQKIKVSTRAVDQAPDSSSCFISQGEEHPLEHLLYGLLLPSGNDCAIAIAEGVTNGKPQQFVDWMNETAARIGATRSHFTNPHGLHDPNHYTTAMDLALIGRAALTNPTVREISGARQFFWPGKSDKDGIYYNHNAMVFTYDDTVGGKTGYTEEARSTLVSAAERNGRLLIGVTMGEPSKEVQYQEMTALLDYGFAEFEEEKAVSAGARFPDLPVSKGKADSIPVVAQADFRVSAPKGGAPKVTVTPNPEPSVTAPVTAGQQLGVVEIREGDRLLGTVPLVAETSVEASLFTLENVKHGALTLLKWVAILVGSLLVFRTVVKAIRKRLRRSRRTPGGSKPQARTLNMYRTRQR